MEWKLELGAQPSDEGTNFRVWATAPHRLEVVLFDQQGRELKNVELKKANDNYFSGFVPEAQPGMRYVYRLDGEKTRPDPVSGYLPEGVHSKSEIVAPAFEWHDGNWRGVMPERAVIYELHVGTATPEGTFRALVEKLPYFKDLGVTVLEIMPIADFPGCRNWGYDGVSLYAPASCYGRPSDLKALVDAAHGQGLAVILDVVYNHFGPDGNYLRDFSPEYFTDDYHTPWGQGVNLDCRPVRDFFINNALYWLHDFHFDGLRLDATHTLRDATNPHFLAELVLKAKANMPERENWLFYAEDERNEAELIRPYHETGYGLTGVWADDFHHIAQVALTGEREGYYQDYAGTSAELAAVLNKGWFYEGQPSLFSGEPRGTTAADLPFYQYVHCIQNHDQIGNRALGDRLNQLVRPEAYRAVSALLLLSPYTPLLFQGQEWAADTPWQFFTDHSQELGQLITKGRQSEFAAFTAYSHQAVPDPQAVATFENSKLRWAEINESKHRQTLALYRQLLALRREIYGTAGLKRTDFKAVAVDKQSVALAIGQQQSGISWLLVVNLGAQSEVDLSQIQAQTGLTGQLLPVLNTEQPGFGGNNSIRCDGDHLAFTTPGASLFRWVKDAG